mmetsp:Transcript_28882/g.72528  ORF Transcript_28882/g.72528 Transcript_28882/m.72528 type:complete len:491 (+) Transcript_28882:180-1652(+)|eukprot:CAMPEP_0174906788 /NCGR_PEP_ID=MMETSP0167-20121228/58357_1 /TAXON_ID=38298 /ORGANISM="Rhodella maculata, Strain CCMP736" /LENGTH=490 /DNA_ID=CAMNT_0016150103 /DNA_START=124 /DNA_END=1596 /DNA_ORIENTATION=+
MTPVSILVLSLAALSLASPPPSPFSSRPGLSSLSDLASAAAAPPELLASASVRHSHHSKCFAVSAGEKNSVERVTSIEGLFLNAESVKTEKEEDGAVLDKVLYVPAVMRKSKTCEAKKGLFDDLEGAVQAAAKLAASASVVVHLPATSYASVKKPEDIPRSSLDIDTAGFCPGCSLKILGPYDDAAGQFGAIRGSLNVFNSSRKDSPDRPMDFSKLELSTPLIDHINTAFPFAVSIEQTMFLADRIFVTHASLRLTKIFLLGTPDAKTPLVTASQSSLLNFQMGLILNGPAGAIAINHSLAYIRYAALVKNRGPGIAVSAGLVAVNGVKIDGNVNEEGFGGGIVAEDGARVHFMGTVEVAGNEARMGSAMALYKSEVTCAPGAFVAILEKGGGDVLKPPVFAIGSEVRGTCNGMPDLEGSDAFAGLAGGARSAVKNAKSFRDLEPSLLAAEPKSRLVGAQNLAVLVVAVFVGVVAWRFVAGKRSGQYSAI